MDFKVTEYKIVNDIVSGPLWKKPLRNYNLYSFIFVSKMNIHNYLKRLLKNTTPTYVQAFSLSQTTVKITDSMQTQI